MANLISVAEYKEIEGIQSAKEDVRLATLVPSVSQLVKTYCGNSIIDYYSTVKTEYFNINWATPVVQLTESPVNSIVVVAERATYSSEYVGLSEENKEYYFDSSTDSIIRTNSSGSKRNWPTGPGSVQILYTAGYESCPDDLKLAVVDLITYYLKDEHKERRTIAGSSIQNASSSSQRDNVAFPDHIKRVLDLYKNF